MSTNITGIIRSYERFPPSEPRIPPALLMQSPYPPVLGLPFRACPDRMDLVGVTTSKYGAGVASDSVKYLAWRKACWKAMDWSITSAHRCFPGLPCTPSRWRASVAHRLGCIRLRLVSERIPDRTQPLHERRNLLPHLSGKIIVCLSLQHFRADRHLIAAHPRHHQLRSAVPDVHAGFPAGGTQLHQSTVLHAFAWMVVFSALAPMQRYVGMALAVTAVIVFFAENRKSIRLFLRDSLMLGRDLHASHRLVADPPQRHDLWDIIRHGRSPTTDVSKTSCSH
jgi:hypothetical protein